MPRKKVKVDWLAKSSLRNPLVSFLANRSHPEEIKHVLRVRGNRGIVYKLAYPCQTLTLLDYITISKYYNEPLSYILELGLSCINKEDYITDVNSLRSLGI